MCAKTCIKFIPGDSFHIRMCAAVRIPPISCRTKQLVCSEEYLLPIVALSNQELLLDHLEPVISFQRILSLRESSSSPQELSKAVLVLRWRRSLLILLQVVENLYHGLHQLGLHSQHLFQMWDVDVDFVGILRL